MLMPWEVLDQLIVMIWLSKFGSGVEKERFGLVLAIFLARPMLILTLHLEPLTVLLNGLYTQMCLQTLTKCVDLFASRLNFKVSTYTLWKPDLGTKYVNYFYMTWNEHYFYAFPPFSVIAACLQKKDKATGVLVVPIWPTQPWFTTLLHLLLDYPFISHSRITY